MDVCGAGGAPAAPPAPHSGCDHRVPGESDAPLAEGLVHRETVVDRPVGQPFPGGLPRQSNQFPVDYPGGGGTGEGVRRVRVAAPTPTTATTRPTSWAGERDSSSTR